MTTRHSYDLLSGIRVLELGTHVFVPIGATILAEWGADVIKIENPDGGDTYRGLVTSGVHKHVNGVDPSFQCVNRGKRSVGLNLKTPGGKAVFDDLVRWCDVFVTNLLPQNRAKLGVEVEDIRALNPKAVYVRGTGQGSKGTQAIQGGYDSTSYYARSGMGVALTPAESMFITQPRPAFGDVMGGLAIAGAVAAALLRRERSGPPAVVDVSLLSVGMWQMQSDIVHAHLEGELGPARIVSRFDVANPISNFFRTKDGRFIRLSFFDSQRHWAEFCARASATALLEDPRFQSTQTRKEHNTECVEALDELFGQRTLEEWREILNDITGVWSAALTAGEVPNDQQVIANQYMVPVEMGNDTTLAVVSTPAQFDDQTVIPVRAPEVGEHTEQVLLELGYTWDQIVGLKSEDAIT
jgi:crotonobetainyl-CoA:carnitine CoA-transferase CaiB-like acyl-CoA transferase